MKISFLCMRHRRWLSNDPAAALYTWLQCYEQGLRLEQERKVTPAIRQAGCALETAELLLNGHPRPERDAIVRYTHSALLLARLLQRQGQTENACAVAHQGIDTLQRLLAAGLEHAEAHKGCERLLALACPAPIPACYQEQYASQRLH